MKACVDCGGEVTRRGTRGPWPQRCLLCTATEQAQHKRVYRERVKKEGVPVHGYGGYAQWIGTQLLAQLEVAA